MLSFWREFSTQQTPDVSVRPSSTSPTSSSLSPLRHDFAFEQCGSRLNFLRWIFFSLIRVGNEVLARFLVDYLTSTWIRNSELKWVKSVIGACRVEKIVLSWKSLRILFFFLRSAESSRVSGGGEAHSREKLKLSHGIFHDERERVWRQERVWCFWKVESPFNLGVLDGAIMWT